MAVITVPPIPEPMMASSWRRVVTGIRVSRSGATTTLLPDDGSQWLAAGDMVQLPAGTVILVVDKTFTGSAANYRTGEPYTVYTPTVTVLRVTGEGDLATVYRRTFKTSKSIYSTTVLGKLRAALETSPAAVVAQVLAEAQRPNRTAEPCRWCGGRVAAAHGHVVGHGDQVQVEHWKQCPPQPARPGDHRVPCTVCGVSVHHTLGVRTVERPAGGPPADGPRHTIQHQSELDCANRPQPEAELIDAELAFQDAQRREQEAADRAAVAKKQKAAQARRDKAAAKRRTKQERERQEAEAMRELVARVGIHYTEPPTNLYDKGLGGGIRMRLDQTVGHLAGADSGADDGTDGTATWWTVTCPGLGISKQFWQRAEARAYYQKFSYDPDRSTTPSRDRAVPVSSCPTPDVEHCGECGSTTAVGGWMAASLGLACDTDCYDAMSDRPGRHDRTHHHHP